MDKNIKLSLEQIDDMKHAIGFQNNLIKGRTKRKYEAYRKHYTTSGDHAGWDELVSLGLATKRPFPEGGEGNMIYFISQEGIAYLSKFTGVEITEMR